MIRRRPKRSLTLCGLETLESRGLMSASGFAHGAQNFVYTETDNSNPNQNAVIAYRQNAQGQVTEIGSFKTDGTGVANTTGALGPDDSNDEVIASPDGRFLFAVNQGSNSVAEFRVNFNGSLDLVGRSAVDSGGTQPISLSIANDRLYVLNRGNEVQGETATVAPTITVFNILPFGGLARDAAATTKLTLGDSPSQLLISSKSQEAFLDTFAPTPVIGNVPDANEVVPFRIAANGSLVPIASGGVGGATVNPPELLGLFQHPTENIVYAGITGAGEVGVFSVDGAGNLKLVDTVAVQGKAPCWTAVSPDGKFLYTVDTGTNSVGVFSLANPLKPVQIQEFTLGGPQNSTGNPTAARQTTDFELSFNPSGNTLYVIDHSTDATGAFQQGNALHVLSVAANGTLSESASSPVFLPSGIPAGADPQGVAVIAAHGIGGIL
jgi:6-phosphogluconolactonase (cycloisomerase 2 family)